MDILMAPVAYDQGLAAACSHARHLRVARRTAVGCDAVLGYFDPPAVRGDDGEARRGRHDLASRPKAPAAGERGNRRHIETAVLAIADDALKLGG